MFFDFWHPKNLVEIVAAYFIGFSIISFGLFFINQGEQNGAFEIWIFQNQEILMKEKASYGGIAISSNTEFFRYEAPFSLFFFHRTFSSGPFFRESKGPHRYLACAAYTFKGEVCRF